MKIKKVEFNQEIELKKFDDELQIAFGWANVAVWKTGEQVVDSHKDMIDVETLELAAYGFVLKYRDADDSHGDEVIGQLVESFMVTKEKLKKMGLAEDALPLGWWVGFHIDDSAIFAKVKDGTYSMMSIGGLAEREEVNGN